MKSVPGVASALATAIIGLLIIIGATDSADEWGPWAVCGLVVLAAGLSLYLARQFRSW